MNHLSWIQRQWIALEYDLLLPLLARLPLPWGRQIAVCRGRLYAYLRRDWRQFSFQDNELHTRTQQTMQQILHNANDSSITKAVIQRYQMQSIEEWEAACINIGRDISQWPVVYEGLDDVLELLRDNPRIIFLIAHYGSSILGTVLLQRLGIPILGMSSNIVDNPRVHPSISRFYRKKYAAMARYLNNGQILDRENNTIKFLRFLQNGGAVVIPSDLPPASQKSALFRPFLGETRGFAPGAFKLAKLANVPLMAFLCEFRDDAYHLRFSSLGEDPYLFIDRTIQSHPSAWWAADILPLLPVDSN